MTKRLSSMRRRFVKATNIAALISMLTSLFTFAPMLPVQAAPAEPLESLSTTLAQPNYSGDWFGTNFASPTYTNVTYTWAQNESFVASGADPCIQAHNCVSIYIDLSDYAPTTTYQGQEWMSTVTTTDFIWNGPANSGVSSTQRLDNDGNGRYEELEIIVGCNDACTFATSTEYSFTIVNYPLKNPESTGVPGAYTTSSHIFGINDDTAAPINSSEVLTSIVVIGDGISVSASADPVLTFSILGVETPATFYADAVDIDTSGLVDSCPFGTLTPGVAKVCSFYLNVSTNAANGYAIYVVQDQDMTYNGQTIKQFADGSRIDDAASALWVAPLSASLAHLGYSSNDTSVFTANINAEWAGIPNIATAGQAPVVTGLVADSAAPGDDQITYALKVESASTLPQAVAASGQAYTHNEYFIVVGNF